MTYTITLYTRNGYKAYKGCTGFVFVQDGAYLKFKDRDGCEHWSTLPFHAVEEVEA